MYSHNDFTFINHDPFAVQGAYFEVMEAGPMPSDDRAEYTVRLIIPQCLKENGWPYWLGAYFHFKLEAEEYEHWDPFITYTGDACYTEARFSSYLPGTAIVTAEVSSTNPNESLFRRHGVKEQLPLEYSPYWSWDLNPDA